MWGKKARVYYHGIPSFCVGCYTVGHVRADCEENSISWKDYINTLVDSGIEKRIFGSWFRSNLSLSRDSHATYAQPSFKRRSTNNDDEDLTLETLSPKLLELFKKFQSSTPNNTRRSPSRGPQGSNSRSSSTNSKPRNENRNRGRGRGRGRGANNNTNDQTDKPNRNKGRGRGG
jgi:hypothetical protein